MKTLKNLTLIATLLGAAIFASPALAQSACPYIADGAVLTAGQWNNCFERKQDVIGYAPVNRAGDVMLGKLTTKASSGSAAGFNIPQGTAPTSPQNGDLWTTLDGLYVRINGFTVGPLAAASANTFAATAPISVTYPSNVVTYALDTDANFSVEASKLALASAGIAYPSSVPGGPQGAGTINATGLYVNGVAVTGAGITELTGDVTALGPGSVAATLATAQPGAHTWAAAQTFSSTIDATGNITSSGAVAGARLVPQASAIPPALGIYAPTPTTMGFATVGALRWSINNVGALSGTGSITASAANAALSLNDTTALGTGIGGEVFFQAQNSSAATVNYAAVKGYATNGTAGVETGDLQILTMRTGALTAWGRFRSDGTLLAGAQTLTFGASGTLTFPASTDTLVGRATTDTLLNKTLASPVLSGTVSGAGTIPNAVLVNSSTAVNGQTCALGGSCTVTAAAGTLSGATLAANVLSSSLTSVGTLTGGATGAGFTVALSTSTITGNLALARLPSIAANSVLMNATAGASTPTAIAVPNCSNALTYDSGTGTFGCNTAGGTGTVTSISAGTGMSFSTITSAGAVAIDKAASSDIYAAVSNKVLTSDGIAAAGAPVTLTPAATLTIDLDSGINFSLAPTANFAIANPSNIANHIGRQFCITFTNDTTPRSITSWGSWFIASGGTSNVNLTQTASAKDLVCAYIKTATEIWILPSNTYTH